MQAEDKFFQILTNPVLLHVLKLQLILN